MKKVVLIGNGGHGKVVKEIVQARSDMELAGILDDGFSGFAVRNGLYTGRTKDVHMLRKLVPEAVFTICIGRNGVRKQFAETLGLEDDDYAALIHPGAIVSETASVGHGTVVMAGPSFRRALTSAPIASSIRARLPIMTMQSEITSIFHRARRLPAE